MNHTHRIFAAALMALIFAPLPGQSQPSPPPETPPAAATRPRLHLREAGTENVWVAYGDAPAFGYGLSPQNLLTCLPPGEARDPDLDYRDFAEWAYAHGVSIVRSYPPSSVVGPRYLDRYERAASDTSRFDLTRFNEAWYTRLREACTALRDREIFVHLQLWQGVSWKKDWPDVYYNPERNVNAELVEHAGPGEFVVDPKRAPALVAHQREHVRRVLEATGDLGNVFYDLMNEIGNGTGTSGEWIEAMLDEIAAWESRTGLDVLVGLNDEGRDRAETGRALSNPRMEIAFLDLGRYDEHVEARAKYKKPTFGVRNIDWNPETKERQYFAGEFDIAINPDSSLASRTRRMYRRLFMAKCQMSAGYADRGRLAYRGRSLASFDLWSFRNFARIFTDSPWVDHYGEMKIAPGAVLESPAPFAYALDSPRAAVIYLEATPGTAGTVFPPGRLRVAPHDAMEKPDARFLRFGDAFWTTGIAMRRDEGLDVDMPDFQDDLVVVLVDSATDAPIRRQPDAAALTVESEGRGARLRWDRNPEGLVARVHRKSTTASVEGAATLSLIAGVTDLTYLDEAPGGGSWEYSVQWRDDVERVIYDSNRVILEVPDVAPVTPEIRPLKIEETRVVLWAAGILEPDVVRYEWERRAAGTQDWTVLEPTTGALFADRGLTKGVPLEYRTRAVDAIGLVGEYSAAFAVTPETPHVPAAPRSVAKVKRLAKPTLIAGAVFAGLALGALLAARRRKAA